MDQREIVLFGKSAGDAADIERRNLADVVGQRTRGDNVGDAEPTAGSEHAGHRAEGGALVGQKVQHANGGRHVPWV